jgi:TRAP-type mannitol/chloroaromatic compound transport system permease small subunit
MSGAAAQRADQPLPKDILRGPLLFVDKHFGYLETALAVVAGFVIFMLMIMGSTEILSRRLLNYPLPGHIDYVELSMSLMAFPAAAYAQRHGAHIRMDMLVNMLKGRWHWFFEALAILIGLMIIAFIIPGTWAHFLRAFQLGDTTMDAGVPVWPSKLMAPFGLAVLWTRLFINFVGYLRLLAYPTFDHVGVPATLTAMQQAIAEAEAALDEDLAARAEEKARKKTPKKEKGA